MVKQLELMPTPRPRVRLEDSPALAGPNVQTMEFPPERVAPVVGGDKPDGTYGPALPLELVPDGHLDRSAWSKGDERPPCQGYWEVTDHRTGALLARWWFGGVWWAKGDPRDPGVDQIHHASFTAKYAFRGLRQPHPDVYPCPPYVSSDLVTRAKDTNVSIRTTYVSYKAPSIAGRGSTQVMVPVTVAYARPRVRL